MTLLYPKQFWNLYGCGAQIYDATGRRLRNVVGANLETGEVITHDMPAIAHAWNRLLWARASDRGPFSWRFGQFFQPPSTGYLLTRHGFWPAPLQVVPAVPDQLVV